MDSMVGYRTPRYLRFGWCGARLDDVMNFLPARMTWLLIAVERRVCPGLFAGQGIHHRLSPKRDSSQSEFRLAGSGDRRRDPASSVGTDLEERAIGDRSLAWRPERPAGIRARRHDARHSGHRHCGIDGRRSRNGAMACGALRQPLAPGGPFVDQPRPLGIAGCVGMGSVDGLCACYERRRLRSGVNESKYGTPSSVQRSAIASDRSFTRTLRG